MTTSFKHLPVAMPSNHGVGLQDPANTEVDSVSISNFELGDSDDDVLTPMASSIPAYQFAPAAAAGSLASGSFSRGRYSGRRRRSALESGNIGQRARLSRYVHHGRYAGL